MELPAMNDGSKPGCGSDDHYFGVLTTCKISITTLAKVTVDLANVNRLFTVIALCAS